ncbi:MAG: choline/ethanolamine kinase family protein [Pseudomonadota bacterium]
MTDQIIDRIHALPIWQGPVSPEPLSGGLSNQSFTVEDGAGRWVVRLGRDFPFHHVDRTREVMVARAAAAAGFAPEVRHAEAGLTVSAFIEGRTYTEADVRRDRPRIAALLRRFHEEMPAQVSGTAVLFWPFHVIRDYVRTLEAAQHRYCDRLTAWLALSARLEAAQLPLPIRFGHNDLLPGNLIDDGERLWLVDFEYAAYTTAMSDLAGLASNAGFDREADQALLGEYFEAPPDPLLVHAFGAMKCAALLREAMWSMVSEIHLDVPGVDYVAYSDENLDRLDMALAAWQAGAP